MNRLILTLLAVSSFLVSTISLESADVRNYHLILPDGARIPTTIVWKDIQGLDTLRGDFHYAAGDLGFSGKNSSSGFIWMNDEHGTYYEFRKETSGSTFRWVGKDAQGERLVLAPSGGGAPRPKPQPPGGATVRHYRYYSPAYEGIPTTIVWENIQGLATLKGHTDLPDGRRMPFKGNNPRSGYITYTDDRGYVYHLTKKTRGNSFEWSGTGKDNLGEFSVTLVPSKQSKPAVPTSDASGGGETVRQYTMTGPWGQNYPATIVWENIKGLGPIRGSLFAPGDNLTITGQNSRSGYISFSDQYGTFYEMNKQNPVNGKVRWTGTARFNDGTSRRIELNGH